MSVDRLAQPDKLKKKRVWHVDLIIFDRIFVKI